MDIYSTSAMLTVVQSLRNQASTWLIDTFFPNGVFSDDEKILFDVEVDSLEIAPFVSPLVAGRVQAREGYETKTFTPAHVKPKDDIKPNAPLQRRMGEPLAGNLSPAERAAAILADILEDQAQQILRRKAVMAAEVLYSGRQTVTGEGYPTVVVDFQRPAGHTVELLTTARWGESGVSPYQMVEGWVNTVSTAVGTAAETVLMTPDAWALYELDPLLEKRLDRTIGQAATIDLAMQAAVPGTPVFRGMVGQTGFWTLQDTYKENGVPKNLFPDYTVITCSRGAMDGIQAHGAILDEGAGYQALEMFPKSWVDNDPSRRYVMTQSAPLIFPRRPAAIHRAKVR